MTGTTKGHTPLIFRPKPTIPAARFLCESWATCYFDHGNSGTYL